MSDETAPDTPMTIEERLAYLEEQNEGLKKVGKLLLALCLLTAGLLVYTQTGQRRAVHSESLLLGGDTPRAALTTSNNGHLAYLFYDHLGILPPEPKFSAIPYLDGFAIYDRMGNPRIVIGINDKDEAILDLVAPDGRVEFSARPRTAPAPGAPAPGAPAPGASAPGAPAAAPPANPTP